MFNGPCWGEEWILHGGSMVAMIAGERRLRRRKGRTAASGWTRSLSGRIELLERRDLLSAAPLGAMPDDTAEYMLGDVLVSVVLMESNPTTSFLNPNTETWTPASIAALKAKVVEGMTWWEDTLTTQFPNTTHELNFSYDWTYADSPVPTDYEPIANISDYFQYWMYDFLNDVGYNQTGSFSGDIRAFNHAQRLAHGTDWAFTIFVANAENDLDGYFASGGSFSKAFSYPGGQFIVAPSTRPASTFAHEAGHIFWARDEYPGGGGWTDQRGYYNSQNLNAANNPTVGFVQSDSIMASSTLLNNAYAAHDSSTSSLEMIGWQDSDGDGIFDVVDIPLRLTGAGRVDPLTGDYRFQGYSAAQTVPNLNSSGLQNDITITRVGRAEYRIDSGAWQTAATFNDYQASLDLTIPLPDTANHTIEIRTIDDRTGVTSEIFSGSTSQPAAKNFVGVNGFVWDDLDKDGGFANGEPGLAGWTVRVVDEYGNPVDWTQQVEPDDFSQGTVLSSLDLATSHGVTLRAIGTGVDVNQQVAARDAVPTSTGGRGFSHLIPDTGWSASWTSDSRKLRMDFTNPVSFVALDAVGNSADDYGRLEIYDSNDNLLARYTTGLLNNADVETMKLVRDAPDIAYAIARGHLGSAVSLDNLRFGIPTSTTTDGFGAYNLTGLPAGGYFVKAESPAGGDSLAYTQHVNLAEGESLGDVNFGGQRTIVSWQNPVESADVNADGELTPLDVLSVINRINAHPGDPAVPDSPATPPPYYDVDGNGFITAADVLRLINLINEQLTQGTGSTTIDVGGGEGETLVRGLAFADTESVLATDASRSVPELRSSETSSASPATAWPTQADSYHRLASRTVTMEDSEAVPQSDPVIEALLDGLADDLLKIS